MVNDIAKLDNMRVQIRPVVANIRPSVLVQCSSVVAAYRSP